MQFFVKMINLTGHYTEIVLIERVQHMSDGELLDAREAMSLLGVNETDLQTMVARGSLRAFR